MENTQQHPSSSVRGEDAQKDTAFSEESLFSPPPWAGEHCSPCWKRSIPVWCHPCPPAAAVMSLLGAPGVQLICRRDALWRGTWSCYTPAASQKTRGTGKLCPRSMRQCPSPRASSTERGCSTCPLRCFPPCPRERRKIPQKPPRKARLCANTHGNVCVCVCVCANTRLHTPGCSLAGLGCCRKHHPPRDTPQNVLVSPA